MDTELLGLQESEKTGQEGSGAPGSCSLLSNPVGSWESKEQAAWESGGVLRVALLQQKGGEKTK